MAEQEIPAEHAVPAKGDSPPDPTDWSTDVFVHRWQAGDEHAFETLYLRFAPLLTVRVHRHRLWHVLRRHYQVEDVVQAIWERVILAARQAFAPSGPGSFLAFLGTLADRTMVDLVRYGGAIKRGDGARQEDVDLVLVGQENAGARHAAAETPTSHARVSEIGELARRILSEREHRAWDLSQRGYTSEEIGFAMGCTDAAVRGLLFRARGRLCVAIGDDEEEVGHDARTGEEDSDEGPESDGEGPSSP